MSRSARAIGDISRHMVKSSVSVFCIAWRQACALITLLAVVFVVMSGHPARAEGDGDSLSPAPAAEPLRMEDYLIAGDDTRVRIILHFSERPDFSWFLLRSPHRLVVDLPRTDFAFAEDTVLKRGLILDVRYGSMTDEQSRIIFAAKGPFGVEDVALIENEGKGGYRLVLDLTSASEADFDRAMLERMNAALSATTGAEGEAAAADAGTKDEDKRFTVAIDPGHGGIDGGARGHSGTQEKAITLAFALELRKALEESGKYRVVLTRDRDVFLRLDERVRIAREQGANLLISIHADAIRLKDFRGSTVYTLSEKASDAEAAATAARENLSDELAGIEAEEIRNDVADILADLMRRETHVFSIQFARTLVNEISDTVQLVNNPLRSAGFRVLRAHDVPSVLLELGYLSNAEDEKQLRDPEWRARAARGIVRAVDLFAEARARAGG